MSDIYDQAEDPWRRLDDYVMRFGPACPAFDCDHVHCLTIRELRTQADAERPWPPIVGRGRGCVLESELAEPALSLPEFLEALDGIRELPERGPDEVH